MFYRLFLSDDEIEFIPKDEAMLRFRVKITHEVITTRENAQDQYKEFLDKVTEITGCATPEELKQKVLNVVHTCKHGFEYKAELAFEYRLCDEDN